ncbi:MAG: hypothetical protein ACRDQT_01800, partial [Gaiellaceae bacterium]
RLPDARAGEAREAPLRVSGIELVKGRAQFAQQEAREIRRLLERIRRSDRGQQKVLRARLRRPPLRFYITDWDESHAGFTGADFDDLIARGAIRVET